MKHYILYVYAGTEPIVHGPFKTIQSADRCAKRLHKKMAEDDSIFYIEGEIVECGSYNSNFFNNS
jgi:hypothetical protein